MADAEWYQVENERGSSVGIDSTMFGNVEFATDVARKLLGSGTYDCLTIVRYTSQAVKKLSKVSTVQETDVSKPA